MNKLTTIVIGLVAGVSLVVGVAAYTKSVPQVDTAGIVGQQGPKGDKGDVGPRGPQGVAGKEAPVRLGALSGPDIPSPYLQWGDVTHPSNGAALRAASTTPWAWQVTATSTIDGGGCNFAVSSSTAMNYTLAKASTPYATTTVFATTSIAANAQGYLNILATSSVSVDTKLAIVDRTVNTGEWIVLGAAGPGGIGAGYVIANYAPVGKCVVNTTVLGQ